MTKKTSQSNLVLIPISLMDKAYSKEERS